MSVPFYSNFSSSIYWAQGQKPYRNNYKAACYYRGCSNPNCVHLDGGSGYPYPYLTINERNLKDYYELISKITSRYKTLMEKFPISFFKGIVSNKFDLDLIMLDNIPKIIKDIDAFLDDHPHFTILFVLERFELLLSKLNNFIDLCTFKYNKEITLNPDLIRFKNEFTDIYNLAIEYEFNPDALYRELEIFRPIKFDESWRINKDILYYY